APIKGWVPNRNVAMSNPLTPARRDNWFPELHGLRLMGGSIRHGTIRHEALPALTGPVDIDETPTLVGKSPLFGGELAPCERIRVGGEDYIVDEIASDTSLTVTEATHVTVSGESGSLITFDHKPVETLFSYQSGGVGYMFASDE